jgi:hypothetical protein
VPGTMPYRPGLLEHELALRQIKRAHSLPPRLKSKSAGKKTLYLKMTLLAWLRSMGAEEKPRPPWMAPARTIIELTVERMRYYSPCGLIEPLGYSTSSTGPWKGREGALLPARVGTSSST